MKKLKSKPFKTIFIQDWGTFTNETLVCVGSSKQEILAFMKANSVKVELIEKFERKPEPKGSSEAFTWSPEGTGCTLLWFRHWSGDPDDLDTLVHETNHLIYDISRDKGFRDEPEIQAYQQAYLFTGILKELTERHTKFLLKKSKSIDKKVKAWQRKRTKGC
jgi:hypothetical protein